MAFLLICLEAIGIFFSIVFTVFLIRKIWSFFRCYFLPSSVDFRSYGGSWCIVTGSTDGIGKEYARQLAGKGLNILLISRSRDKLEAVAEEIQQETKGKVEIKILPMDFSGPSTIYKEIERFISKEQLDVGVLVNNVGMAYGAPDKFFDVPNGADLFTKILNVNTNSAIQMTYLILPEMIRRRNGLIINMSSASARWPVPYLTVYSATKAFLDYFSRALNAEYRQHGITIQSVLPSFVATKMVSARRQTFWMPSAKDYVKQSLKTTHLQSRTSGYISHALQAGFHQFLIDFLPPSVISNLIKNTIYQRMVQIKQWQRRKQNNSQ